MFYDNNSLKLSYMILSRIRVTVTVISTAEFQLLTMIDRFRSKVNEFKMMVPFFSIGSLI